MAFIYKKEQTDSFNMRNISRSVREYFDTYKVLSENIDDYNIGNLTARLDKEKVSKTNKKTDIVWSAVMEHEKLVNQLRQINKKIGYLKKYRFTDLEKEIFEHSIINRETDMEIMDKIVTVSHVTYKQIKKSCYIKVAVMFGLTRGFEKSILKAMELVDNTN